MQKNLLNNYYKKKNHLISIGLTSKEEEYLKNNPIIKVHNESNWPPYNYNINKNPKGFSIDYMNLLASKVGVNIEYISGFSWDEYIEKLKNNEIDVMLNISKTPLRNEIFNFTSSYTKSIDTVFTKKGSNLKKLKDFDGKTIAIIKGFYEEELLKKYYPNIKLISTNDTIESLKKVAFGEVDGAIDSFAVGNYYIQNNLISNVKPAFEIEDERFNLDMHLATNKNNMLLNDILEKAKAKISEEEFIQLKRKWLIEEKAIDKNIDLTLEEKNYLKNKEEITMCVDPDLEPFEIINKNGVHEGISADLINLISKKLDIKIRLIPTKTWEETLNFSKEKKCDILSFLNETPKRKEWLNFTNPIFEDPNVIVGRNEFDNIEDLSKLQNKTIAIPKGTAMYERFEKDFPNLIIIPVETENEAFSLVENKKADMTVRSLIIAAYTIKKENLFNLKILAKPLEYKNQLRIGVIKEEPILVNILNKGIKNITKKEHEYIINTHVSIKIPENYKYLTIFIYSLFFIILITILILFWNYQLRKRIEIEIKKNTEQQNIMFQQNKKAELGNLIGNISHQWRDSLTKIGYINLNLRARILQKKEISNEFLDESTEQIEKSLDFMSETMQNFLDYYKPSSNVSNFEVYDSIKSALTIIDTKIKYSGLEIIFNGDFSVRIEGIRNEWMQVWINIIINSINISIMRDIKNPQIEIYLSKNEIVFQDNCGKIKEELLEKINKEKYTGIGIKMAKEIANKNNQEMIISNSKKGAIFKFVKYSNSTFAHRFQ